MARTGVWALPAANPPRPPRPPRASPLRTGVTWRATAALTADVLLLGLLVLAGLAVRLWVLGINDELNADEVHPRADGPPHPLRRRASGLLLRPALLRRRRGLPHRRAVRRLRLLPPAGRRPGHRRLAAARPGHLRSSGATWPGAPPACWPPSRWPSPRRSWPSSTPTAGAASPWPSCSTGLTLLAYLAAYLRPPGDARCPAAGRCSSPCWPACCAGSGSRPWPCSRVLVPLLLWRQPSLRHPLRLLLALAPLAVGLAPPAGLQPRRGLAVGHPAGAQVQLAPGLGGRPGHRQGRRRRSGRCC